MSLPTVPLPLKMTVLVAAVVRPPAILTMVVPVAELQVNRPVTVRSPVPTGGGRERQVDVGVEDGAGVQVDGGTAIDN